MNTVCELKDVTVSRGGKTILDSVSWKTCVGEHWVILGPNGAGKTTLVRTAIGRDVPASGSVMVCGVDTSEASGTELAATIGFASQSLRQKIRPSLTVKDVVRSAAWGMNDTWDETYEDVDDERVEALMAAFGIEAYADRRYGTLSEGERQRTMLARSLMTDPEVLVLDEPGSGLDLGAREILVSALTEILQGPTAPQLLLVTHQVEEIPPGITHAAVMKQGRIIASGPIHKVLNGVVLSEAYELPLTAGSREGRWWARAV